MTHHASLSLEHILLDNAVKLLENYNTERSTMDNLDERAAIMIIISCVTAIESFVNRIYLNHTNFSHFDELRLRSAIENLFSIKGKEFNWGDDPFNQFTTLIKLRNHFIHFKDSYLGLYSAEGELVEDSVNKKPKYNPNEILTFSKCEKYLEQTFELISLIENVYDIPEYSKIDKNNLRYYLEH
jgi:hypothetical protein